MRRVRAIVPPTERAEFKTEQNLVHYDGVGLLGSQTLCGHFDQVTWTWKVTSKKVNCHGCLAVVAHVKGTT